MMIIQLREFQRAIQKKYAINGFAELAARVRLDQQFVAGNEAAELRANLVEEECKELAEALRTGTLKEVLKELCDVLYVAMAIAAVYALPIIPAFNRVHKNNMDKIAGGTIRADGKLVKPADHPKPDFSDLVAA